MTNKMCDLNYLHNTHLFDILGECIFQYIGADYTLWNMEWNMEWNIGYETSVMSQELHFYDKTVTVLDLYHSHLNLYTKSAFV